MKGCLGCIGIIVFSAVFVTGATYVWRVTHPAEAVYEDAKNARIDREAAAHREFLAKHPEAGHESEICIGVHHRVEDRLKAPASADFPSCIWDQSQVKYAGNGVYNFSSWVDAQNGFGAKIRTYYDGEAVIDDQALAAHEFRITHLDMH